MEKIQIRKRHIKSKKYHIESSNIKVGIKEIKTLQHLFFFITLSTLCWFF